MKRCLNGTGLPSPSLLPPEAHCPALSLQRCQEEEGPTWLAGSSSSLLSEDPSASFSGGAGTRVLLLAVLGLPSF